MRLLFFSNVYPQPLSPNKGTFNGTLVRALAKEHIVHVICPIAWTDRLKRWGTRFSARPVLIEPGITASYPTFWYPPKILRTYYHQFLERSVNRRVDRDLKTFRPDAVLSYWAHPDAAVAVRIARRHGIPAVTMVGGSDVLLLGRQGKRREVILQTLRDSDAVIAVSADIAEKLREDGIPSEKLHVVRRGVEGGLFCPGDRTTARGELGLTPERHQLVGVGRLVPVKDWSTLIEACALLKRRGLEFHCNIIGDGPLRESLHRLIAQHQLQEQITLRGGQPQAQLANWYRAADLVVLSSLSEGVPNVLLESIACGTPFVASNVGGIPEIADPLIHSLVPAGEPTSFANAIFEQLSRPPAAASRRFQSLSSDTSARRVTDIITKCQTTHPSLGLHPVEIEHGNNSHLFENLANANPARHP